LVDVFSLDLGPKRYGTLKLGIWLIQVDLLKMLKEKESILARPIPLKVLYEYAKKGWDYLCQIDNNDMEMIILWKNSTLFLKDLIEVIEEFFAKRSCIEDPPKKGYPFSHFIDMEKEISEVKVAAGHKKTSEQLNKSLLEKRHSPFFDTASTVSQQVWNEDESFVKKLKTQDSFLRIERGLSQEIDSEKGDES